MKILLVDADSKRDFPNLALMKLSAWYKQEGFDVDLIRGIPDTPPLEKYEQVLFSCIFEKNADRVLRFASLFDCYTGFGGSGLDLGIKLNDSVEHIMPDYALYEIDYSMGFTSRGCIRKCDFCVVPIKEGPIRDHAPIEEFHEPTHDKMILLDNNFLASPKYRENFEYLIENKIKVNFNQGLDIRLVTEENAKLLRETKYQTWKFNTRRVSFAYDSPRYKDQVEKGITTLLDTGISKSSLMFYVLVGYDTELEEDLARIDHLLSLGVDPYIMRYDQTKGENRILMHLARWVNWRVHRSCSFWEYDYSDSQEVIQEYLSRGCPQRAFRGAT